MPAGRAASGADDKAWHGDPGDATSESGRGGVNAPARDLPPGAAALEEDDPAALGSCRLLGRLGEGGMGTVYLGLTPEGRRVAVKTIHPHLARDEGFRARFAREVAHARRLDSPFTPAVLDADTDARRPFLVTPYVPGPTLHRFIREHGPLDRHDARQVAVNVLSAIAAFHRAGIVHRDIKPMNVILSPTGPKVIDLGVSRALDGPTQLTPTGSQQPGTWQVMAPEQWNGTVATKASDIFAWGCLVVYASTGRYPFRGSRAEELRHAILTSPPDLPADDVFLRPILDRALAKTPDRRPTADELLTSLLDTPPQAPPADAPVAPPNQPRPVSRAIELASTNDSVDGAVEEKTPAAVKSGESGESGERGHRYRPTRRATLALAAGVATSAGAAILVRTTSIFDDQAPIDDDGRLGGTVSRSPDPPTISPTPSLLSPPPTSPTVSAAVSMPHSLKPRVTIFNNSRIRDLAGKAVPLVERLGYTAVAMGNLATRPGGLSGSLALARTTIFYEAGVEAAAGVLAEALSIYDEEIRIRLNDSRDVLPDGSLILVLTRNFEIPA